MHPITRYARALAMMGFLAATLATAGCSVHAGYRAYDPGYHDYHTWDDHEDHAYRAYLSERHEDYRDYKKLNHDQQNDYWKWRHSHPD